MDNESIYETENGVTATLGFFDGVHRGHRFLIEQMKEVARKHGTKSMVITFDKHPRQVLHSDYVPLMLSSLEEKVKMIEEMGVDECEVLTFSKEMALLSAFDFMKHVLKDKLNVKFLVIGYDNRFGHNRSEGFEEYKKFGKELGIEVIKAKAFVLNGVTISSSVVRSFLSEGEIEMAEMCLGYKYKLSGNVVDGVKEGRKMGYPTANIDLNEIKKLIPANGVYAVTVAWKGAKKDFMGMMNIGNRPTFNGLNTTMEVNILDFSGNLYGKEICVTFVKRLRTERKFSSEKALMAQLEQDKKNTIKCLSNS